MCCTFAKRPELYMMHFIKVNFKPEFEAVSKYSFYLSSFFEHPQFLHFLKNKTVVSVISCLWWTMLPRQN